MISVVMTCAVEVMTTGGLWLLVFLVLVVRVVGVGVLVALEVWDVGVDVLAVEDAGFVLVELTWEELAVEPGVALELDCDEAVDELAGAELEDLLLLLMVLEEDFTLVGVEMVLDCDELDCVEVLALVMAELDGVELLVLDWVELDWVELVWMELLVLVATVELD